MSLDISFYLRKIFDVAPSKDLMDYNVSNGYRVLNSTRTRDFSEEDFILSLEARHGGEGEGEEYWYVFKYFDKFDQTVTYIKFEGIYSSWSDVEWTEDPRIVVPEVRPVTFYVDVE